MRSDEIGNEEVFLLRFLGGLVEQLLELIIVPMPGFIDLR